MATSYGKRLGKTQTIIEQLEVDMAQARNGTLAAVGDVELFKNMRGIYAYDIGFDIGVQAGGVADALSQITRIKDAVLTVAQKGRAYGVGDTRVTVHVWSKDVAVLKNVKEAFGGNYYRHGSGFTWMCSKQSHLVRVWKLVSPHLPPNHRLELLEEMCK